MLLMDSNIQNTQSKREASGVLPKINVKSHKAAVYYQQILN